MGLCYMIVAEHHLMLAALVVLEFKCLDQPPSYMHTLL